MSAPSGVWLRPYTSLDAEACATLLYETVHGGTGCFYSTAQRRAWAPAPLAEQVMAERLGSQEVFLAEDHLGLAGFMTLKSPGYMDFAYVRLDCMGKGVAGQLYVALLTRARQLGFSELTTEASELAKRFLMRRGWELGPRQDLQRYGVDLYNYAMRLPQIQ